jgi:phage-related protein
MRLGWLGRGRNGTMADNIGTAYVQIEPSFEGVVPEIDKHFGGAGASGGKSFTAGFGKAMAGFGVATAAAGAAIGAIGSKFVSATADVASYGDNIDKMSQKMGLTAEAYQEWDAVMQHSGTSMETMKASMKTLANAAESGNDAFKMLGISQKEIANMSQQELFEATIAGLQNVTDDTQRTYLAGKLLGRGATELGALLNTSAEDTQAMRDRVRELGGVMSQEAVSASAAFQDQLQDMQTAFQGLSRGLTAEFLPSMTTVMSGLTEIFSGNAEGGLSQISEGINGIVEGITKALPQIAQTATTILEALATAIMQNLPQLVQTGFEILSQLATYIVENLPTLIQTGLQIILQLAMGIAQALPELIPAIVETVLTIAEYLIENVDLLIDAAIALIMGLAEGLINALPILIEKAPEIVIKLVEAIIRNAPKILEAATKLIFMLVEGIVKLFGKIIEVGAQLVEKVKSGFSQKVQDAKNWGRDIIDNFINGIKEKWEHLKQTVGQVAESIKSYLGFSEPELGPLSRFHTFAPDMMELYAKGITENAGLVRNALTDATSGLMDPSVDVSAVRTIQTNNESVSSDSGVSMGRVAALLETFVENFKQEIYLDTGVLVGATAPAYNAALGQIAVRGGNR